MPAPAPVPDVRLRTVNDRPPDPDGRHVLYWMIATRRPDRNFGLQRAASWARHLGRPLTVLEPLRCTYRWASRRLHRFVVEGMVDNARAFAKRRVTYHPWVEPEPGDGRELLTTLAADACVVVTDRFPCAGLPALVESAGRRLEVALEEVDSLGLYPVASADRAFPTAYSFRRVLQRELPGHLAQPPLENPLQRLPEPEPLPASFTSRWPALPEDVLAGDEAALDRLLDALPIDQTVGPTAMTGGPSAARRELDDFVDARLRRYVDERNHPASDASSGLSPWLHFGHLSAHAVFDAVTEAEGWTPAQLCPPADGRRAGWWNLGEASEAFLDQLVTWRELSANASVHRDDFDRLSSVPDWARATLAEHADDPRPQVYELAEFETAATHDELWNAVQRQLLREGRMHNTLRMVWGKKILHWTASPQDALDVMIALNDRWAVDGRDPNSYGGILWVLGRHDRAWGPERPVFGKVRYMTTANAARKLKVKPYLERYGPSPGSPASDRTRRRSR